MASELERLKLQNTVLKAELERLKKYANENSGRMLMVGSGSEREMNQRQIRSTFDLYDRDHSGYIDREELAHAAMMLNEVLDEEELESAFASIDIDDDGKISFEEFSKWWQTPDRQVSDKPLMKMAAIKAKLTADLFVENVPDVIRSLSERSLSLDEHSTVNHSWTFELGDVSAPRASLKLQPKFEKGTPSVFNDFPESEASFSLRFGVDPSRTPQQREESHADITEAMKQAPSAQYRIVSDEATGDTLLVFGAPPDARDPFKELAKLDVDLNAFVQDMQFSVDLGVALSDLVNTDNPPPGTLAHHLAARVAFRLKFSKALIDAFLSGADSPMKWQQLGTLLAVTWLEESEIDLKFGGFDTFIEGMKESLQARSLVDMMKRSHEMQLSQLVALSAPPEIVNAVKAQQDQELAALRSKEEGGDLPFYLSVHWYTHEGYQRELKRQYNALWAVMMKSLPVKMAPLLQSFQEHFTELKGVSFTTKSGVGFELVCNQFFPMVLLPKFHVDQDTQECRLED